MAFRAVPLSRRCSSFVDEQQLSSPLKRKSISQLPEEIWLLILAFLSPQDLLRVRLSCKMFYRLCFDPSICRPVIRNYFTSISDTELHHLRELFAGLKRTSSKKSLQVLQRISSSTWSLVFSHLCGSRCRVCKLKVPASRIKYCDTCCNPDAIYCPRHFGDHINGSDPESSFHCFACQKESCKGAESACLYNHSCFGPQCASCITRCEKCGIQNCDYCFPVKMLYCEGCHKYFCRTCTAFRPICSFCHDQYGKMACSRECEKKLSTTVCGMTRSHGAILYSCRDCVRTHRPSHCDTCSVMGCQTCVTLTSCLGCNNSNCLQCNEITCIVCAFGLCLKCKELEVSLISECQKCNKSICVACLRPGEAHHCSCGFEIKEWCPHCNFQCDSCKLPHSLTPPVSLSQNELSLIVAGIFSLEQTAKELQNRITNYTDSQSPLPQDTTSKPEGLGVLQRRISRVQQQLEETSTLISDYVETEELLTLPYSQSSFS